MLAAEALVVAFFAPLLIGITLLQALAEREFERRCRRVRHARISRRIDLAARVIPMPHRAA